MNQEDLVVVRLRENAVDRGSLRIVEMAVCQVYRFTRRPETLCAVGETSMIDLAHDARLKEIPSPLQGLSRDMIALKLSWSRVFPPNCYDTLDLSVQGYSPIDLDPGRLPLHTHRTTIDSRYRATLQFYS